MKYMTARVLIVEDNAVNRELMDYLLRSFGFQTLGAVHGGVGIDMARREEPDLIICDIEMPMMDGFEFARQAKHDERLRHIPLIAVTAYAMVGDRERILATGFDGYVSKPIEPLEFVRVVRSFLPSAAVADRPAAEPIATAAPLGRDRRGTILVVDDTPLNLELKRNLLEPFGYEVVTADNIPLALQLAHEYRPALIVSDVGLRSGSGFDLIRRLKADPQLKDIPFIFNSSTYHDEASQALGLELGAVRFLLRPMEPSDLLAEIEACLRDAPGKR
jgi:two-component system cell cycle response regulator